MKKLFLIPLLACFSCVMAFANVAKIGTTEFATFAEATAAVADGQTIQLLADCEYATRWTIDGMVVTLDLNGHNLTYTGTSRGVLVQNGAKLTLKDAAASAVPTIDLTASPMSRNAIDYTSGVYELKDGIWVLAGSELIINSGRYEATEGVALVLGNLATVTVNGGVLISRDNGVLMGNGTPAYAGYVMNVHGGILYGEIVTGGYASMAIYHPNNGRLNIDGGTLVSTNGPAVVVRGGESNITGGEIVAKGSNSGKCGDASLVLQAVGVVTDFSSAYPGVASTDVAISGTVSVSGAAGAVSAVHGSAPAEEASKVNVSGGEFNTAVPAEMCAAGYDPVTTPNEQGKYVVNATCAAMIGDTKYETLSLALNAAGANDVVKMVTDAALDEYEFNKAITLDFNGHIITVGTNYGLTVKTATVTFTDSSVAKNGGITVGKGCLDVYSKAIINGGVYTTTTVGQRGAVIWANAPSAQVEINGGSLNGVEMGVSVDAGASLLVTGGSISALNGTQYGYAVSNNGTTTIEGGELIGTSLGVAVWKDATLNVTGGTMYGAEYGITGNGSNHDGTHITISGGTVGSANTEIGIYHPQNGVLTINGGTIIGETALYIKSGNINIAGGDIQSVGAKADYVFNGNGANATGDAIVVDAAGYPGGAPTVTISGGTVTSENAEAVGSYEKDETVAEATGAITGGTYSSAVPVELCATDYAPQANANGTYGIAHIDYDRAVTEGNFGTLCVEKDGLLSGAVLYEIAYKEGSKLVFDEVLDNKLVGGKSYVFKSTGDAIAVVYNDGAATKAVDDSNGMRGNLSSVNANIAQGNYIIKNNLFYLVDTDNVKCAPNRAYILSTISTTPTTPAPGRRRVVLQMGAAEEATAIENIEAGANAQKVMINGELFIIRGEHMFNAAGQIVK